MSNTTNFPKTIRIGILLYDGFEPIDVWGFTEAFAIARFIGTEYLDPPAYPFEILFISNEVRPAGKKDAIPAPVKSQNGPRATPDMFRDDALDHPFDLLMIPGGNTGPLLEPDSQAVQDLMAWVKEMDQRVTLMTSVCTGAGVLAYSGLLDGKPAATNHSAFGWITGFGPKVLWNNVSRWVDAGRYVTSAGVSAGTDMAFYLVQRLAGRSVAEAAAMQAEYDWHRDPDQPIFYPQQAAVPTKRDKPASERQRREI